MRSSTLLNFALFVLGSAISKGATIQTTGFVDFNPFGASALSTGGSTPLSQAHNFTNTWNGEASSATASGDASVLGSGIGLALGSKNSLAITNVSPGYFYSVSTAGFSDLLTFSAIPLYATLSLEFEVSGSAKSSGLSYSDALITMVTSDPGLGGTVVGLDHENRTTAEAVVLTTPVSHSLWSGGLQRTLGLRLEARNCLGCGFDFSDRYGTDVSGVSDFISTMTLKRVILRDSSGAEITGISITGEDGAVYLSADPGGDGTVPEPSSLAMCALAAVALGGRIWGKRAA